MNSNKRPWPLTTIYGIRNRINTNPDYQRPPVWSKSQKQLLIDTILRDYDVPKLYWRKTGTRPDTFDVVDGQQRLRAIWEYFDGGFNLPKDAEPINGEDIANCSYEDLPNDLRMQLDVYPLDIVTIEDTDEEETREMFLRLQNGTTLRAQEKRNAYPGQMRNFVRELSQNSFFKKVGFANTRYTYDLVAAQLVCLEIAAEPTNVKNSDLNKMYLNNIGYDSESQQSKSIKRTLERLNKIFAEETPELTRYNVIALFCVISELQQQYVISEIEDYFYDWFLEFEQERRNQEAKSEDETNPEWISYKEKISHSTDSADSIRHRMEFMLKSLLGKHPTLSLLDNQRDFTHMQKLTVFRRDKGNCQLKIKCDGSSKLKWDNWHCDHIIPWSRGGKSTVENGQVSCPTCNLSKGNTN